MHLRSLSVVLLQKNIMGKTGRGKQSKGKSSGPSSARKNCRVASARSSTVDSSKPSRGKCTFYLLISFFRIITMIAILICCFISFH